MARFAVFALGFSAVVTQLVLLRELLSAFSGNELGLGVMLGVWLLLMGLGSWAGRTAVRLKQPAAVFAWAQILVALWPLVAVALLRVLRNVVFIRGVEVGVAETVLGCVAALLPYCVVSGYLLTLACNAPLVAQPCSLPAAAHGLEGRATPRQPLGLAAVYFLDSLGSIVGGALFTFVLIHFLSPLGLLVLPAFLNLLAVVALGLRNRRLAAPVAAVAMGLGLAALLAVCNVERATVALQFPEPNLLFAGDSPYGRLVVTESAGQLSFYENGVPCFSTQNTEQVEEKVHYALAQRPAARRVLLLSGGVSGTAREILKYGVERVDYVELDPLIVQAGRQYAPENLQAQRINVIAADARVFVRETRERYGVVIVDVPAPTTAQLNRLYTREFYEAVNGILEPDGVLCFASVEYRDYVSPEVARVLGTVHATLKQVFANVLMIPSGRVYFLASQGALHKDIAARLEQSGVRTRHVNRSYLRAIMAPDRLADMQRAVADGGALNEDFSPVLYYAHLREWLSRFQARLGLFAVSLAALLALFLWRIRAVPFAIFTAGLAASGLEVVLLMGFQIVFGSVYRELGAIITVFMAGLAAGSWAGRRVQLGGPGWRGVRNCALAIALLAALLPLALRLLGSATVFSAGGFMAVAFVVAGLVAAQFTVAGRGSPAAASELYTADFLGACLGALLVSTLLIPLLGVSVVCWAIGGMNLLGAVVISIAGRRGGG